MEDFYYGGGMKAFLKEVNPFLKKGTNTIEGKLLSKVIKENAKSLEPGANLNPVPQSIKGKMAPRKWTKTNIKELAQKDYEMNKKKT